jgi:hypothetical protein
MVQNATCLAQFWRSFLRSPHHTRRWPMPHDCCEKPAPAAKFWRPPQHAAVFCVDEKTAIQALDRLDPVLPLSPGRAERQKG